MNSKLTGQVTKRFRGQNGFTRVEVVVVVLVAVGLAAVAYAFGRADIVGSFTTRPAIVPAGVGTPFVYTVTRKWLWSERPKSGVEVNFRLSPDGPITISLASGTTDETGTIIVVVTPDEDYRGGGNIWAMDAKSWEEDYPAHFTVVEDEVYVEDDDDDYDDDDYDDDDYDDDDEEPIDEGEDEYEVEVEVETADNYIDHDDDDDD